MQSQFLTILFSNSKNDTSHLLVINLKKVNQHISWKNFQMEGLFLLKEIFQEGNYRGKIDLKDSYFSVPRIFTKLMKIPISLLRKLNIYYVIISGRNDTRRRHFNIPSTKFGFLNQCKKIGTWQTLQFLGVKLNPKETTLTLPQGKKDKIDSKKKLTLLTLWRSHWFPQLIGQLVSTAFVVMPTALEYRSMQRQQIMEWALKKDFDSLIELTEEKRSELNWWV